MPRIWHVDTPQMKLTKTDTSFYHYIPQLNLMFSPDLHKQSHCSLNAKTMDFLTHFIGLFTAARFVATNYSWISCHLCCGHKFKVGTILLFELDPRQEFQRFLQALHRPPVPIDIELVAVAVATKKVDPVQSVIHPDLRLIKRRTWPTISTSCMTRGSHSNSSNFLCLQSPLQKPLRGPDLAIRRSCTCCPSSHPDSFCNSQLLSRPTLILFPVCVFGVRLARQPDIPLLWAEAPGFYLLAPNEVQVAEVREVGHLGENKDLGKTRKRVQPVTWHKLLFSPWANAVCPHRKSAVLYELCTVRCAREKGASARVQVVLVPTLSSRTHGCCHWLSAKLRFRNSVRTESNLDKTRHAVRLSGCWWQLWACRFESAGTSRLVALTTSSKKQEFEVVSLTIALAIYRPVKCAGAIFVQSNSMKTNSTMLSLVTSWMRRMADDFLLRNVLPILCSATHSTFAVNDPSCYVNVSFHLLG